VLQEASVGQNVFVELFDHGGVGQPKGAAGMMQAIRGARPQAAQGVRQARCCRGLGAGEVTLHRLDGVFTMAACAVKICGRGRAMGRCQGAPLVMEPADRLHARDGVTE
jgi:hypothetical protein